MTLAARLGALLVIAFAVAAAPAAADPLGARSGSRSTDPGRHSRQLQRHDPFAADPGPAARRQRALLEFRADRVRLAADDPDSVHRYDPRVGCAALVDPQCHASGVDPTGHLAIGAGELVYNQSTNYARADGNALTGTGAETQYSRIAGAHYEVAARLPILADRLEVELDYAPVLLGTQVSTYTDGSPTRYDPERGEQIETNVQFTHHVGRHTDMIFGVRYVNFTAAYDIPSKPLSDRNAAVLPSFGYLWHL